MCLLVHMQHATRACCVCLAEGCRLHAGRIAEAAEAAGLEMSELPALLLEHAQSEQHKLQMERRLKAASNKVDLFKLKATAKEKELDQLRTQFKSRTLLTARTAADAAPSNVRVLTRCAMTFLCRAARVVVLGGGACGHCGSPVRQRAPAGQHFRQAWLLGPGLRDGRGRQGLHHEDHAGQPGI